MHLLVKRILANVSVYVLSMKYNKIHISIHKIQLLFRLEDTDIEARLYLMNWCTYRLYVGEFDPEMVGGVP